MTKTVASISLVDEAKIDMRKLFGYLLLFVLTVGCGANDVAKPSDEAGSESAISDLDATSGEGAIGTNGNDDQATLPKTAGSTIFAVKMLSWNVESEGSDPVVIAQELGELGEYDVYALTEVMPGAFETFRKAAGEKYRYAFSKSGFNDRMLIVYNEERFELVRNFELDDINHQKRYRSPLVAHLKDKLSNTEFLVMVNHLARGKAEVRQEQAKKLVEWAREQTMPVVALGDYNLDYVFADENGNAAFKDMMRDNVWKWIQPIEWIDTNWYDNPREPDGKDDYPGSMLDFAFVAGPAKDWSVSCKVIVREGDFPDSEKTSDHRPFEIVAMAE